LDVGCGRVEGREEVLAAAAAAAAAEVVVIGEDWNDCSSFAGAGALAKEGRGMSLEWFIFDFILVARKVSTVPVSLESGFGAMGGGLGGTPGPTLGANPSCRD
jgi:hypothetical protein